MLGLEVASETQEACRERSPCSDHEHGRTDGDAGRRPAGKSCRRPRKRDEHRKAMAGKSDEAKSGAAPCLRQPPPMRQVSRHGGEHPRKRAAQGRRRTKGGSPSQAPGRANHVVRNPHLGRQRSWDAPLQLGFGEHEQEVARPDGFDSSRVHVQLPGAGTTDEHDLTVFRLDFRDGPQQAAGRRENSKARAAGEPVRTCSGRWTETECRRRRCHCAAVFVLSARSPSRARAHGDNTPTSPGD